MKRHLLGLAAFLAVLGASSLVGGAHAAPPPIPATPTPCIYGCTVAPNNTTTSAAVTYTPTITLGTSGGPYSSYTVGQRQKCLVTGSGGQVAGGDLLCRWEDINWSGTGTLPYLKGDEVGLINSGSGTITAGQAYYVNIQNPGTGGYTGVDAFSYGLTSQTGTITNMTGFHALPAATSTSGTLNASITASATSMAVNVSTGTLVVGDVCNLPSTGEYVSVTAVSGSSNPYTATITRQSYAPVAEAAATSGATVNCAQLPTNYFALNNSDPAQQIKNVGQYLFAQGSQARPSFYAIGAFGVQSGGYWDSSGNFYIEAAGAPVAIFKQNSGTGYRYMIDPNRSNGWMINSEPGTSCALPEFIVNSGDATTGLGATASGHASLCASGVTGVDVTSSAVTFAQSAYVSCAALTTNASGVIGCTPSDPRLKTIHGPFTPSAAAVASVVRDGGTIVYSGKPGNPENLDTRTQGGFNCAVIAKYVTLGTHVDAKGYCNLDPMALTAALFNAVAEQQAEIEALKRRLNP